MALDFNFGDLEQKLTGLSRKVSNELTDKALKAGGDIVLNEHSSAKWLTKDTLYSVDWLPADLAITLPSTIVAMVASEVFHITFLSVALSGSTVAVSMRLPFSAEVLPAQ